MSAFGRTNGPFLAPGVPGFSSRGRWTGGRPRQARGTGDSGAWTEAHLGGHTHMFCNALAADIQSHTEDVRSLLLEYDRCLNDPDCVNKGTLADLQVDFLEAYGDLADAIQEAVRRCVNPDRVHGR